MAVKILGGEARGLTLPSPGNKTRPTLVQLKRRLFDFKQDWSDCLFVDLCSGTGSMGLEAWSRGAKKVILVENDKNLQKKMSQFLLEIEKKYSHLGQCQALMISADKWIKQIAHWYQALEATERENVVIYLDPPYESHQLYLSIVMSFKTFQSEYRGRFLIESDELKGFSSKQLVEELGPHQKIFTQGASFLALWDFRSSL